MFMERDMKEFKEKMPKKDRKQTEGVVQVTIQWTPLWLQLLINAWEQKKNKRETFKRLKHF